MCKIMEDYAREANIDTAIKTAMTLNATTERIVQVLVEEFGLDADDALQRIEEFINDTKTA